MSVIEINTHASRVRHEGDTSASRDYYQAFVTTLVSARGNLLSNVPTSRFIASGSDRKFAFEARAISELLHDTEIDSTTASRPSPQNLVSRLRLGFGSKPNCSKSYTAHEANKILIRAGSFWQREAYDHWIRNEAELGRIVHYIEANPVDAGLSQRTEDYLWCSCHDRILQDGEVKGWLGWK